MQELLYMMTLTILFKIAFEDFRERKVSLYWFLLLPIFGIVMGLFQVSYWDLVLSTLINLSFLGIQFLMLWLYFRFVRKVKSLNELIGLGDIVFLAVACIFFSSTYYIVYYVFGIIISLVLAIALKWTNDKATIPLAGVMSVILMSILVLQYLKLLNLRSEYLIW